MANNRMYLVCNVCNPKDREDYWDGKGVLPLAKWYPGGLDEKGSAYYRNDNGEKLAKEFLEFLNQHTHPEYPSECYTAGAGQDNPVRLEYEIDDLPILEQKKTRDAGNEVVEV